MTRTARPRGGNSFVQGEPGKWEWCRPISFSSLPPSPSPAATRAHALEPNVSGGLQCRPRQQLTAQSACPHLHNLPLRPTLQRSCLGPRVGEGDPKCEEKNQQLLPTPLARHSVLQRNTPFDNPWHPAPTGWGGRQCVHLVLGDSAPPSSSRCVCGRLSS